MSPAYDDCPSYCGTLEIKFQDYCETCPAKRQQDEFQRILEAELTEELGDDWKEYGLANLLTSVHTIQGLEDSTQETRTVTAQSLLDILEEERAKKDRIERYAERQQLRDGE